MPIQSTLRDGIIYTELSGEIVYDAVIAHTDFIFSLAGQVNNQYELHDHTRTQGMNLFADDIRKIAAYSLKLRNIFQHSFIAVYAPSDFAYGIARMFEAYFELADHSIQAQIFRDKTEAIEFLTHHMARYG